MADLISLNELHTALGIPDADTGSDAQYAQAIQWASRAVINFTGRDFGSELVTETRQYVYDDSGFLDIDDANSITSVEIVVPNGTNVPLTTYDYAPMPARRDDTPVFTYILLPGLWGSGYSPEMGFKSNLDVLYREGRLRGLPTMVAVTGEWGWPTVPDDVKQAVVWAIEDWAGAGSSSGSDNLTAESIESYSRSWAVNNNASTASVNAGLPQRTIDLLSAYTKILV